MHNAGTREPFSGQPVYILPGDLGLLTASSQGLVPHAFDLAPELANTLPIAGYCVVGIVANQDGAQPHALLLYRLVHTGAEFIFDRTELCCKALPYGFTHDLELPIPIGAAIVRKSQKVKGLRLASPVVPLAISPGISAKSDEPGLLGVKLERKPLKSLMKL